MPDIVQNIIVDFQVDYSEITTAQEQLARSGKIDTKQFTAVNQAISNTSKDAKGLIADFKAVATTATKMGKSVEDAFGTGIQDALDEAGVSVEDFSAALTKANAPTKSLKAELRDLKEALALAKANGKDTGAEFEALRTRAGQLSDAIADAGAEIKNAGSDTRNLDNIVGSVSALAGGFAAAQGAAALFGDENEDVQKALLKVNGAMAVASGLQQVYNATLKEGAVTKLADSIATGAQSAAMTLYTFVTGGATVATKAFRAALLATGIGAIVVLVVALVQALDDTSVSLEEVNKGIERQNALLESSNKIISDQATLQEARAKAIGASESELIKIRGQAAQDQLNNIGQINRELEAERDQLKSTSLQYGALNKQIEENNAKRKDLRNTIEILKIEGSAAIKKEVEETEKAAKELAKKRADDNKKALAEARAFREAQLKDTLAFLERDLLTSQKGSEIELDLKKKIVRQKALIELNQEKLTDNQILLIKAQSLREQLDLQKAFNDTATKDQLQSQIDTNNTLLAGIEINNEERLRLSIDNLEAAAKLEINAAEGNATKILLIEAKKLSDIRQLKIAAIDKERQDQIASGAQSSAVVTAALNQVANDAKKSADVRIAALRGIETQVRLSIQNEINDNNRKNDEKLISDKEYNDRNSELLNEQAQNEADTNERIIQIKKDAAKKQKEAIIEVAQQTLQVAGQVADFFSNLSALATEQEQQRIAAQKRQLQTLVDAGAITEKQAKIRAQQIEIAEVRARQRQAVREKQTAVFRALLAIPTAFLNGLTQGGIYLAAIYGALAAAEAAIVIARPVPKFFRGKKDSYEGRGIVADMGSELVERNGRMFLYTKPTETYLRAKDKVYTASETRQIMHNSKLSTTIVNPGGQQIDYKKFAASFPKQVGTNINIDKEFISEAVANGLSKTNYFNKRYKSWR